MKPVDFKKIDINELLMFLKDPNFHKHLYHEYQRLKILYENNMLETEVIEPIVFDEESNTIPLWHDEFFPKNPTEKLREFIKDLLSYPSVQKLILDDYFLVLKPSLDKSFFTTESIIAN